MVQALFTLTTLTQPRPNQKLKKSAQGVVRAGGGEKKKNFERCKRLGYVNRFPFRVSQSPLQVLSSLLSHVGSALYNLRSQALQGLLNLGRVALSALLSNWLTAAEIDDFFDKVTAFVNNAASNAVRVAEAVLTNLGGLFGTLLEGIRGGFSAFFNHLGQHLLQGALDWAFGGIQANLSIPNPLNLPNIAYFFLQLVGATWDQIKTRVLGKLGISQQAFDTAIQGVDWLADLLDDGPQQALFGLLSEPKGDKRTQRGHSCFLWTFPPRALNLSPCHAPHVLPWAASATTSSVAVMADPRSFTRMPIPGRFSRPSVMPA